MGISHQASNRGRMIESGLFLRVKHEFVAFQEWVWSVTILQGSTILILHRQSQQIFFLYNGLICYASLGGLNSSCIEY